MMNAHSISRGETPPTSCGARARDGINAAITGAPLHGWSYDKLSDVPAVIGRETFGVVEGRAGRRVRIPKISRRMAN